MDKVLSIDLDILMSPYCGVYNDSVDCGGDRNFNWKLIGDMFDVNDFKVNREYRQTLTRIIDTYSKIVNKIYIAYDHSAIINAIELEKDNLKDNYVFDVYNIDYHHDIFYGEKGGNRLADNGFSDCGSWVGFLQMVNCIDTYHWYRGIGSDYNKHYLNGNFVPNIDIKRFNDDTFPLDLDDVKVMFIALSFPWIPPHSTDDVLKVLSNLPNDKVVNLEGPHSINMDAKPFLDRM